MMVAISCCDPVLFVILILVVSNDGVAIIAKLSKLGEPPETKDDVWIYTDSDGYADTVKFYFKNDTVTKIEWDFWID